MVQIEVHVVEQDVDVVPASRQVLCVQRLMDIANEVNDKLGRLGAHRGPQGRVQQLARVVLQRADDAPLGLAVAIEVDGAVRGRAVLGVDEVEGLGEAAPARVSHTIRPRCDACEVVVGVIAQQALEIRRRVIGHQVGRKVGDGYVTEACACAMSSVFC